MRLAFKKTGYLQKEITRSVILELVNIEKNLKMSLRPCTVALTERNHDNLDPGNSWRSRSSISTHREMVNHHGQEKVM